MQFAQGGAVACEASCAPHRAPFIRPLAAFRNLHTMLKGECNILADQVTKFPSNTENVLLSIAGNDLMRIEPNGLPAVTQTVASAVQRLGERGAHTYILGKAGGPLPPLVELSINTHDLQVTDRFFRAFCEREKEWCTYVDISDIPFKSEDGVHYNQDTSALVVERFQEYLAR